MVSPPKADKQLDWYNRYARHIALEEVGESGQKALNRASVLIVGTGGLGSPAAFYLTAAGVGTLGLVDYDNVSLNNLQRQLLHGTSDVGKPKVHSALETLNEINPEVNIHTCQEKVTPESIWDLVSGYDLKLILGRSGHEVGSTLKNRLLLYDGKESSFRTVKLSKNPGCPVCADPAFDFRRVNYSDTCALEGSPTTPLESLSKTDPSLAAEAAKP